MRAARISRLVGLVVVVVFAASCDYVERVSVNTGGGDANGQSFHPAISSDGHYVAFWSSANNIVPGDTNSAQDVFVRNTRTNKTIRASVAAAGGNANGDSFWPTISGDGRYVAFASRATDLVVGDGSSSEDIFVRDLQNGTTTRVTVDTAGGDPDARTVTARISADGRHVVFASAATDLVAGDGNGVGDVFVRDLDAHTTVRASVDTGNGDPNAVSGAPGVESAPAIDADGSRVVFFSNASDLVAGDANGFSDIFLRDLTAGTTTRMSVDTTGGDANGPSNSSGGTPAITGDGTTVAFASSASDLATGDANGAGSDVFVRNVAAATTVLANAGSLGGSGPSLSADGRYVAFQTTQIWVHDLQNDSTAMASAKFARPANGLSGAAVLSADGRYVAFHTSADNLGVADGNGFDVYVRAVTVPKIESVTPDTVGQGTTATLIVSGTGFLPGTTAFVSGAGVTVDEVAVISETELEVSVTVAANAAPGPHIALVWTPATGAGNLATSFGLHVLHVAS